MKGTRREDSFTGDLKDMLSKALEMGHLSLRELYEGNPKGRLLHWGPERYAK